MNKKIVRSPCGLVMIAMALLITGRSFGQSTVSPMPEIIGKNGRHALLVDGKPFFLLGGQAHNSSGWPGMMSQVWQAVQEMHANTLEVPIYWEQIEAQPGKFDFSLIDILLTQAREHRVHLVLLWFATWKNGSNHYMPGWMKHDAGKYPDITGIKGQPVDSPSPDVPATQEADTRAFVAVMRYLKKADPDHTVIMVQVENEPGAWDTVRDYSPAAQKLFEGPVPAELLRSEVLKALNHPSAGSGSWQKVFGNDADEYFQAWSVARFIGQVAAAGKAEYALPMYVNAALRDPLTHPSANTYESGGPTDNVIPIWKAAAPAIDLVAPDIYLSGSEKIMKVIELYTRPDNPLFVPEAGLAAEKEKYLYPVLAAGGIGFSPFGIDNTGREVKESQSADRLEPFAQDYAVIAPMMREMAEWALEGKIQAVVEREDHAEQTIDLGAWKANLSFGTGMRNNLQTNSEPTGRAMIVRLDENKFLLIGSRCHITFSPAGNNTGKAWQYGQVEEGRYENGAFQLLRILNGDETDWGGPRLGITPVVLRISLIVR